MLPLFSIMTLYYSATKPIATAFVDHCSEELRSFFKLLIHLNSYYFHKALHKILETYIARIIYGEIKHGCILSTNILYALYSITSLL